MTPASGSSGPEPGTQGGWSKAHAGSDVLTAKDQLLAADVPGIRVDACGGEVCGATRSAGRAIGLAIEHQPDQLLMDTRLQGDTSGFLAALAVQDLWDAERIDCTASGEPSMIRRINADDVFEILIKPLAPEAPGRALLAD